MYAVHLAPLDSPLSVPVPIRATPPDHAESVVVHYQRFIEAATVEYTDCQTNALFCNNTLYFSDKETAWDVAEYLRGGTQLRIDRSVHRRSSV